jgi:hypothetical protein
MRREMLEPYPSFYEIDFLSGTGYGRVMLIEALFGLVSRFSDHRVFP